MVRHATAGAADEGDRTLAECFSVFALIHEVTTEHATITRIAREVVEDFASDRVVYLELRTTPKVLSSALMAPLHTLKATATPKPTPTSNPFPSYFTSNGFFARGAYHDHVHTTFKTRTASREVGGTCWPDTFVSQSVGRQSCDPGALAVSHRRAAA